MAKLILTNEVTGLGSAGDVVEVKNGYARNYLIRRASPWPGAVVARSRSRRSARSRVPRDPRSRRRRGAEELARGRTPSSCRSRPGNEGRLFGSVKPADVADAVKAAGLGELDKRKIQITSSIKSVASTRRPFACV